MRLSVYMIQGLLVGIGATMHSGSYQHRHHNTGQGLEIDTIAMVVIGGTALSGGKGNIVGTLIGVFFLGSTANAMNLLRLPSEVQFLVKVRRHYRGVGGRRLVADLRIPRPETGASEGAQRGGDGEERRGRKDEGSVEADRRDCSVRSLGTEHRRRKKDRELVK